MTLTLSSGLPHDECGRCRLAVAPIVRVFEERSMNAGVSVCTICLSAAIDSVTGWRWQAMMLHSLAISGAGERFHDPLADRSAAKARSSPKKYRSKVHQADSLARAADKLGLREEGAS